MKYLLISLLFICSCKSEQIVKWEILDFNVFQIKCPKGTVYIKKRGIDSFIGQLVFKNDTFKFDYGYYSNMLGEGDPHIVDHRHFSEYKSIFPDLEEEIADGYVIFSSFPEFDMRYRTFSIQYYLTDTIDNVIVRYCLPKRKGKGFVGAFFENVDSNGNHFTIYTRDIDEYTHNIFLEMISSIKFY